MIPPCSALYIYDSSSGGPRQREMERARRENILRERPPRPDHKFLCRCDECVQWARDIVKAPAVPAGGGA